MQAHNHYSLLSIQYSLKSAYTITMFVGQKKYRWVSITAFTLGVVLILGYTFLVVRFPKRYDDIVQNAAIAHGVSPALIHAVIQAESGYDKNAVSKAGAVGLMQIMPRTGRYIADLMGLEFNIDMLVDPYYNINMGTFYLSRLMQRFELNNAIAAYNAGEGNVSKWIAQGLETIPFPETRTYVRRVLLYKRIYMGLGA